MSIAVSSFGRSLRSRPLKRVVFTTFSTKTESSDEQFGYQKVGQGEKEGLVRGVFSNVADNYDVMNDLMSAGMHRIWKDQFVKKIGISSMCSVQGENTELKFLDVAGGTGDISFRIIDELNKNSAFDHMKENNKNDEKEDEIKDSDNLHALISPKALVTISDINPNMLSVGKNRAYKRFTEPNILEHVAFQEANAEKLPFADESFDVYTIAFGLRNVTNIDKALIEAKRVLKPGGRFLCLEFSAIPPAYGPLGQIYDAYSFAIIPKLGEIVANDKASYQYLVESIRLFPKQKELCEKMINQAGFSHVSYENYTGGVVAVHTGFKC